MWLYFAMDYLEKNIAKKYEKQQIVNIVWQSFVIINRTSL